MKNIDIKFVSARILMFLFGHMLLTLYVICVGSRVRLIAVILNVE